MDNDILNQLNLGADSPFGHYETKIMKLQNLLEITKIINSTLEEDKLAQIILYSCQGQFLIQNASLIILEDVDRGIYHDKISIGLEKDHFDIQFNRTSFLVKLFQKVIGDDSEGRIEFHRQIFAFKDIENKISDPLELQNLKNLCPEIISPLLGKNSLYGFLFLGPKLDGSSFTNQELTYIFQFSEMAAISIENAKLFEMAILDRMTRLYNHQYFKNRLYEEIERTRRYHHPLSLMFFDIDHFKSFNDTYGHQIGDIVLKGVSNIIKDSVRKSDVPARYGGEEFSVILPETTITDALLVGEKIRKKIEKHPFAVGDKTLHVTISCGIAQYPPTNLNSLTDGITATDFINMADSALYASKRGGRNMVSVWSEELSKMGGEEAH